MFKFGKAFVETLVKDVDSVALQPGRRILGISLRMDEASWLILDVTSSLRSNRMGYRPGAADPIFFNHRRLSSSECNLCASAEGGCGTKHRRVPRGVPTAEGVLCHSRCCSVRRCGRRGCQKAASKANRKGWQSHGRRVTALAHVWPERVPGGRE